MELNDQDGVPLQMLDIFVYGENRGLNLTKAVVLGFIDSGWIQYIDLSRLERNDLKTKPSTWYQNHYGSKVWTMKSILYKKRPGNLLRIGRWQPSKESVEQIQCPELVDIILENL